MAPGAPKPITSKCFAQNRTVETAHQFSVTSAHHKWYKPIPIASGGPSATHSFSKRTFTERLHRA